jgi:signal transduction histidine kinase
MRRIEDQRTGRWAGHGGRAPGHGGAPAAEPSAAPAPTAAADAEPVANDLVHPPAVRWGGTAGAAVVGASLVALSTTLSDSDHDFLLIHALASVPFSAAGLVITRRTLRDCPPEYEGFWHRYWQGLLLSTLAGLAALGGVVLDSRALVGLDMLLIVAAIPIWASAGLRMLEAQAGKLSISVDLLDTAMALCVLGAPMVLLIAEPLSESTQLIFAIPFALAVFVAPAGLYVSFVNLARIPPGQRVTQGLGLALAVAFTIDATMQLARVLGGLDLALGWFVAVHATQMALLMLLPLWAHRHTTGRLARLAPDQQLRASNPMPYVSAVVLPLLALWVLATRDSRPWEVAFLIVVLLVIILLNAVRYTLMSREARQLSAELGAMAEERRLLLANMVRALEHDRHRTVTELHTQAVGSLATLSAIVQSVSVSLPSETALAVRETIAQLQGDLGDRAEELRQLMVAMRPPAFTRSGDDSALGAALAAYASELYQERSTRPVTVHVDPELELDRSTMTIVYRIAQEALLNAARHSGAHSVAVSVTEQGGNVLVEVVDDGIGFELQAVDGGSGLAAMKLFTNLGRGELTVRSSPGQGTLVRSLLGVRAHEQPGDHHASPPLTPERGPGRLRLIVGSPETQE